MLYLVTNVQIMYTTVQRFGVGKIDPMVSLIAKILTRLHFFEQKRCKNSNMKSQFKITVNIYFFI